jgi:hypothetical protein
VGENEARSNGINQMILADPVVRNDEAVGSIPTSSTIFSITCSLSEGQLCSILFQTFKLAGSLPQLTSAGVVRKSEQNKFLISENRNSLRQFCNQTRFPPVSIGLAARERFGSQHGLTTFDAQGRHDLFGRRDGRRSESSGQLGSPAGSSAKWT